MTVDFMMVNGSRFILMEQLPKSFLMMKEKETKSGCRIIKMAVGRIIRSIRKTHSLPTMTSPTMQTCRSKRSLSLARKAYSMENGNGFMRMVKRK